jgi:hypothetical protein
MVEADASPSEFGTFGPCAAAFARDLCPYRRPARRPIVDGRDKGSVVVVINTGGSS